jgi:PKD repeat protein
MKILSLIAGVFLTTTALAQVNEVYWCGQYAAQQKLFQRRAHVADEVRAAEEELTAHTRWYESERAGDEQIYTIPVVFHIIHNNGPENISDEQVYNAIEIMTRDFRMQNSDIESVQPEFQGITADCHIEFKLATRDPQGNCHTGINRVQSNLTYDGGNDAMKQLINWPRSKYLNIWVCFDAGGAAGFSNYPSSVASSWEAFLDGIVMNYNYVGSIGESNETRSRTLTHEAGHWLNLRHLWGNSNDPGLDSNCNLSDDVADTPRTIGHTSCSLRASTCDGTLDNVQNYMEYSYCSNMFTMGQRARMRAALTSSVSSRNQLHTNSNLIATGVINPPLCAAKFISDKKTVCLGEEVIFTDKSYHGVTAWSWNFGDGTILEGNNPSVHKNPAHIYQSPGYYNVTLTVSNGSTSQNVTYNQFIHVIGESAIGYNLQEGFEGAWPNEFFTVDNQDNGVTFEITPTAAFSGSKSLKLRNHGNTQVGNKDVLYTAIFDLSNAANPKLSYQWAYTSKQVVSNDKLVISFSGDCGNTWDVRRTREGQSNLMTAAPTNAQFTPSNTDQWNGETLTIGFAQWQTERFQAKFEFEGRGGNNFYLDDINITAEFPVGVQEIKPLYAIGIYPNPSRESMTLDLLLDNSDDLTIDLYNTVGQVVENLWTGHLASGKHVFHIQHQSPGLYTVVIKKGDHIGIQKVIFE